MSVAAIVSRICLRFLISFTIMYMQYTTLAKKRTCITYIHTPMSKEPAREKPVTKTESMAAYTAAQTTYIFRRFM